MNFRQRANRIQVIRPVYDKQKKQGRSQIVFSFPSHATEISGLDPMEVNKLNQDEKDSLICYFYKDQKTIHDVTENIHLASILLKKRSNRNRLDIHRLKASMAILKMTIKEYEENNE